MKILYLRLDVDMILMCSDIELKLYCDVCGKVFDNPNNMYISIEHTEHGHKFQGCDGSSLFVGILVEKLHKEMCKYG
jgi:hypothetical protein